ncbi:MAG: enoyl-CoA hydratase/isomerase family protein [Deltaproteobacteria bacterium]|nr:enoyl-CoA hydratase/isomerase family protein [Deltaproteobacteria bacterium]
MSLMKYEIDGQVAILTWNSGENRYNPDFLKTHLNTMAEIEEKTDARVLVVRSAHEKIWCNGIDLDWLAPLVFEGDKEPIKKFFFQLNDFFRSFLTSPLITLACMNGHTFAGGVMAACTCDYRYMRSDRGFLCIPEVDLGMRFLPGMLAILKNSIPGHTIKDMALSGRRLTAEQCLAAGIIQKACHMDELLDETLAFAGTLIKERAVVAAIKRDLYSEVLRVMDIEDPVVIHAGEWSV